MRPKTNMQKKTDSVSENDPVLDEPAECEHKNLDGDLDQIPVQPETRQEFEDQSVAGDDEYRKRGVRKCGLKNR